MTDSRTQDPEVAAFAGAIRDLAVAEDYEFSDSLVWELAALCKRYRFENRWHRKLLEQRRNLRKLADSLSSDLERTAAGLDQLLDNNYLMNLIIWNHPDFPDEPELPEPGDFPDEAWQEHGDVVLNFRLRLPKLREELRQLRSAVEATRFATESDEPIGRMPLLPPFSFRTGPKSDFARRALFDGVMALLREHLAGESEAAYAEMINEIFSIVGARQPKIRTLKEDWIRPLLQGE